MWNGNIGTFTPNPKNIPAKIHIWLVRAIAVVAPPESARMSKVLASASPAKVPSAKKNRAKKLTSINAEPNRV